MRLLSALLLPAVLFGEPAWGAPDDTAWSQLAAVLDRRTDEPFSARFTQERATPLLAEPIVSRGTLRSADDVVRFDTEDPHRSTMVVEASSVTAYYHGDKVAERYPMDPRANPLAALTRRDLDALRDGFEAEIAEIDTTVTVTLTPLREDAADSSGASDALAERITFTLGRDRGELRQVRFTDPDGQPTTLTFTDFRTEPRMTPADLRLKLPPYVELRDYTRPEGTSP